MSDFFAVDSVQEFALENCSCSAGCGGEIDSFDSAIKKAEMGDLNGLKKRVFAARTKKSVISTAELDEMTDPKKGQSRSGHRAKMRKKQALKRAADRRLRIIGGSGDGAIGQSSYKHRSQLLHFC